VAVTIGGSEPTVAERCLGKIVDFFGIERRILSPDRAIRDGHLDDLEDSTYSVLVSAARLNDVLKTPRPISLPPLLRKAASVFVFDFDSSASSVMVLRSLTGAPNADVIRQPSGRRVSVTHAVPDLCGVLSGITAECSAEDDDRAFVGVRRSAAFRGLMSAEGGVVSFDIQREGVRFFLSAAGPSVDIDLPVRGTFFDIRHCFSGVVPLAIFLKEAFPGAVGSTRRAGAALVVDDPALKRRYGFLHFGDVLASMKRHDFCTTIAFIPWNWYRTNPRTADLFRKNCDRYALAVHGCDHTSWEFGTAALPLLNHKVKAARHRADRHLRRTGIRISPIMVFPQGVFSPEAAYVLKHNNFIAAVNTEVNPLASATGTLVRELWNVAILQYSSFPVFTRRYMSHGLENFAFDVFLGKPCLLVAHHEVFRDDGRELTAFVDSLNSLKGGLGWGSLEKVIAASYGRCEYRNGPACVRMFANDMILDAPTQAETVLVEKTEFDPTAVARVICDGREIEWTWQRGRIQFSVATVQQLPVVVRVEYADPFGESTAREGTKYRIEVRARRYLSEIRDDYVCRSDFLNTYTGRIIRLLR
jgi:hypothetical protein